MRYKFILFFILILAFILCFYKLGSYPISLDWDEASLGYNAYSILKTGKDEYGNFMPLQFRSFGDYKPPLYVYLTVPSIKIFGFNDFATRLPSATFGFLTVIVVYFLIGKLFPDLNKKYRLLGTFIFAISPWHLQFTRVAFEANVGLFWFSLGVLLFLKAQEKKSFYLFSGLAFVLSIYSYHSLRLITPLFVVGLSIIYLKNIRDNNKTVIISGILGVMLLIPLLFLVNEGAASRFLSVSNATPESLDQSILRMEYDIRRGDRLGILLNNRRLVYFFSVVKGYLDHYNPSFLFLTGDPPGRHHAPDMGMLYFIEFPLILIGFYSLIFDFKNKGKYVLLLWFFLAPIASSLTTGTPHAVRALFFLPTYQIIVTLGIWKISRYSKTFLPFVLVFLYTVSVYYYLDMYYIQSSVEQAADWQYGYKQAVEMVNDIKKDNEKVVVTYKYDQPYIYFLFYNKIDPVWYQNQWRGGDIERFNRAFGDYEFRNINWQEDKNLQNTILVGTPAELPADSFIQENEIKFPNGDVAFRIVKTN